MGNKLLMVIILAGSLLAAALPGRTAAQQEGTYSRLRTVLQERGVSLQSIDLEGWNIREGTVQQVWSDLSRQELLVQCLRDGGQRQANAGSLAYAVNLAHGGHMELQIQKMDGKSEGDLCYILIKCTLPGNADGKDWESKLHRMLAGCGGQYGSYLALHGRLSPRPSPAAESALARGIYRELGGRITATQRNGRYLSLSGFSPLLGEGVEAGKSRINLSLALVHPAGEASGELILATPVITCEY